MGTKFPFLVTKFRDLTVKELCVISNLTSQMDPSIKVETCQNWKDKDQEALVNLVITNLDKVHRYAVQDDDGNYRLVPQSDETKNATIDAVVGGPNPPAQTTNPSSTSQKGTAMTTATTKTKNVNTKRGISNKDKATLDKLPTTKDVRNGKASAKTVSKANTGKASKKFPDDAKIKVLVKDNPKRAGSASAVRFAKLKTGMNVKEALAAGVTVADLDWDTSHKFIEIG